MSPTSCSGPSQEPKTSQNASTVSPKSFQNRPSLAHIPAIAKAKGRRHEAVAIEIYIPGLPIYIQGLPIYIPGLPIYIPGLPIYIPGLPIYIPGPRC